MTSDNKLPDFVRLGARIRISYEGVVTAIEKGPLRSMVIEDNGRTRAFPKAPPAGIPPTVELIEAAPNPVPDEPTNVGAVVEIDGYRFTRVHSVRDVAMSAPWANERGERWHWSTLMHGASGGDKEVKILSPGYDPESASAPTENQAQQLNSAIDLVRREDVLSVLDRNGYGWHRTHGQATKWVRVGDPSINRHTASLPYPVTVKN